MAPVGSSYLGVSRSGTSRAGTEAGASVVWLRGEHDISTTAALSDTIARAIALDDRAVVIDLSGVQFISAATVGVLIRTREFLSGRSRPLTLRCPAKCVRKVFEACGLSDLLDPESADEMGAGESGAALGTWVAVPSTDRIDAYVDSPLPTPIRLSDLLPDRHERSKRSEKSVVGPEGG